MSATALGAIPSIGYALSFISFAVIGLAIRKYVKRLEELTRGLSDENNSDFLDIVSPILIASILSIGVGVAIIMAIHNWEVSRYS